MAKAKAKTKASGKSMAAKTKTLTVEFAGICTLVTTKSGKQAQVWLVDVASALKAARRPDLATKHSAVLSVSSSEKQSFTSNQTVGVAGNPREYAVWKLDNSIVSFDVGQPVELSFPKHGTSRREQGVSKLVPLHDVCFGSRQPRLLKGVSKKLTCAVKVPGGAITSLVMNAKRKLKFVDRGTVVQPPQEYAVRFRLKLPFADRVTINIKDKKTGKQKVELVFEKSTSILIGNMCQEVGSQRDHFQAHYTLVSGGRKPVISKYDKNESMFKPADDQLPGAFYPFWEFCIPAMFVAKTIAFLI